MDSLDFMRKENLKAQADLMREGRGALKSVAPNNVERSWAERVPSLERALAVKQSEIALRSVAAAPFVVAAEGAHVPPAGPINTLGFSGVVFGDVPVREALMSPPRTYKKALDNGMTAHQAQMHARSTLDRLMKTIAADTARGAMGTAVTIRPGMGYVRMVSMPACSRCLILAGKFYRWNQGFQRHPNCDCVHKPTTVGSYEEALDKGLVTDPYEAFFALSEDEQDRMFGKHSAQAIRDGADMFQIVNARLGRRGDLTVSGLGKHAWARQNRPGIMRYGRLTPEAIYLRAKSREHAIQMLDRAGYILPVGQVPTGGIVGQRVGFGQFGHGGAWKGGVNERIVAALNSGVRDPLEVATMTAAERRVFEAARDYDLVLRGINPFGETALVMRGAPRIGGSDLPLTPEIAARVEAHYHIVMQARGELTEIKRLYRLGMGRSLDTVDAENLRLMHDLRRVVVAAERRDAVAAAAVISEAEALVAGRGVPAAGGQDGGRKPPRKTSLTAGDDDYEELFRHGRGGVDGTLDLSRYDTHRNAVIRRHREFTDKKGLRVPPKDALSLPGHWPDDAPILDIKTWNHILYSDISGGGHLAGYGWIHGKTEFPPDWSESVVFEALKHVISGYDFQATRVSILSGRYRGVDVEVVIKRRRNSMRIATFYVARLV